jgi:predicted LPLAT superfamily acyltransferase
MLAGKEEKPEQALMKQYVKVLESVVEQYPDQWFYYYKFWYE